MIGCIITCVATIICADVSMAQDVEIPRWHPQDLIFSTNEISHDNPFKVQFSATVQRPDGTEFDIAGFYDGNNSWKVRISPTDEGIWSVETHSDEPSLDGKKSSFTCVPNKNPNIHGGLLVDSSNPYHFVYEDGTRYFMMGYECDWLWALDMDDPDIPDLTKFLDLLKSYGFNNIILNAYAHDTSWCKDKTRDYDYGPPPKYAWEGTNENPVHDRFNLEYWQHYDRVINALFERGITAHIMIKVYNKMVNFPPIGSPEDDMFFKWVIARYSAYPNVIWDFSKEANNEKNLEYKLDRFDFIKKNDPYKRLITNHDDGKTYNEGAYDGVLDFRSDQQHSKWHETILDQRKQNVWPVVNVEFGYEHGPDGIDDKTYGVVQPPKEVCRRAWEICLAGGYIAYYYTYTAWDVIRPEDIPPGYAYFKYIHEFFANTEYWLMNPADELIDDGYCLANKGEEYIFFVNKVDILKIDLGYVSGLFEAYWYNPFTGESVDADELTGGEHEINPPIDWYGSPLAFHVKKKG